MLRTWYISNPMDILVFFEIRSSVCDQSVEGDDRASYLIARVQCGQ